eukprot:TRINITY_DN8984_c0_g1_i1.p1 TRINITY_DN8984_c0_g1~~TRINITY_DN8984_c0_g1_i1.p1  ORF type:complete len:124 (-),score=9.60 TRINITY_DN8984_c0_g1_i1:20-391(-)
MGGESGQLLPRQGTALLHLHLPRLRHLVLAAGDRRGEKPTTAVLPEGLEDRGRAMRQENPVVVQIPKKRHLVDDVEVTPLGPRVRLHVKGRRCSRERASALLICWTLAKLHMSRVSCINRVVT